VQDKQNNLDDLLTWEMLQYRALLPKVVDARNVEIAQKIEELRDRGLLGDYGVSSPGIASREIANIVMGSIEKIAMEMIYWRRKTAGKNPVLASVEHLRRLQETIFGFIDAQERGAVDLIARRSGAKVPSSEAPLSQDIARIKSEIRSDLSTLEIEIKTGLGVDSPPPSHITIQGSSIGDLNFGTIVGNIQANATTLEESGNPDVARAIRELVHAIETSTEFQQEQERQEAAELVGEIAKQASLPTNERSARSVIMTVVARSKALLSELTSTHQLWQKLESLLKAFFE
jgi:hypothetical protein